MSGTVGMAEGKRLPDDVWQEHLIPLRKRQEDAANTEFQSLSKEDKLTVRLCFYRGFALDVWHISVS